jgi:4-amino-4-deoxy-L-arabinose transferase-like glycosyltransferase
MNRSGEGNTAVYYLGIFVISALMFIPFLGQVHLFDWDEINFAESAREMISSHDYLTVRINYIPFWEKPPLFIWMQVLSMKIFGINEFAARFPNAVCGILTLFLVFRIGRNLVDNRFGLTWVVLFGGSVLPFLYFKSGIIDPWFNLFIFLGIYCAYRFFLSEKYRIPCLTGSAMFIGLAVLTKGPVALLVFMLTGAIYLIMHKFKLKIRFTDILIYLIVLALVGGFWFILQIIKGNFGIISDFISYQIRLFRTHGAGHSGFLLYHFVVLFLGVFPASLLALPALFGSDAEKGTKKDFLQVMLILFWVVLILFTIVKTKIVHYSSLCYFPLTFAASWWLYYIQNSSATVKGIIRGLVTVTGILLAITAGALTAIDLYKDAIIGRNMIRDPFAIACLRADAGWHGYEFLVSVVLLAGVVLFNLFWNKDRFKAVFILSGLVSVFMFLSMFMIAPRIEMYSQRPALEFFESVSGQDAYLVTLGYKSYAQLFYGKARNHENPNLKDEKWPVNGDIDKPVYIAAKSYKTREFLSEYPDLVLLYEKNGFAFFIRVPKSYP